MTWVQPELVIRAEIGGWTRDGIVRQTAFKGIDEGHDPLAVTREQAVSSEEAAAQAEELMPGIERKSTNKRRAKTAARPRGAGDLRRRDRGRARGARGAAQRGAVAGRGP